MTEIVQIGHPVLRQQAAALSIAEIKTHEIQSLILAMKDTMQAAPGVGLAAPQIGESLQLVVIEDRAEFLQRFSPQQLAARGRKPVPFHVLINPVIRQLATETIAFYEGCLSIQSLVGMVPRALRVAVQALNEHGEPITIEAEGWYARILQHEIDHLNGTLCIDRTDLRTLSTVDNYLAFGTS